MKKEEFVTLKLIVGQVVLIHLRNGGIICGAYQGNFNDSTAKFEIENHRTNKIETVELESIDEFVV